VTFQTNNDENLAMDSQDFVLHSAPANSRREVNVDPHPQLPDPVTCPPPRPLASRVRRTLGTETEGLHFRLLLANLILRLLPNASFGRLRTAIYRLGGLQIGARSIILGRIEFTGVGSIAKRLRIGSNVFINSHCFFDLNADIDIGDWVSIGHHVTFITAGHDLGPAQCRAGKINSQPISVGSGSWIGARTALLPGVSIGNASVVAAGSVVSGAVPANRLVGGAPARPLKSLPAEP
jgi:acetyltransferase-like isoleucine patch superfamily enzyme